MLAGTATGTPKHGDDCVEMIRILKLARDSAVKSQTQAVNQLKAVIVTAPLAPVMRRPRPSAATTAPTSSAKHGSG